MLESVVQRLLPVPVCNAYVVHLFGDGECNSHCLWCIRQYNAFRKCLVGTITRKQFTRFLDLNENCKAPLIPYGLGEPTIHDEFVPFCELALNRGWVLESIHTNLSSKLSDATLKTLAKFKSVTVNIGGTTEQVQRINMGTSLHEAVTNLMRLKEFAERTQITVKMVVNKNNFHQRPELPKLFKYLGLKAKAYPVYFAVSDSSDEKEKMLFYNRNFGGLNVPCREKVEVVNGKVVTESKLKKCYGLVPTVHTNGLVTVCCRARWYGGFVGNAFEESMCEIMDSQQYKRAVFKAKRRKYVEYCKYCS